jgi:glycosyltransferase involved in cell wall biosynthesis
MDGELVVLTVGRLSREKGHIDLIEALARLQSRYRAKPFRILMIGDGPERASIGARIQQLGLSGVVSLIGFQDDLNPYYTLADLLVLPSHTEGSPNVLLEAMAAGVPAVATRVGGVPDIAIEDETALLVAKGDSDAMAAAVGRLLEDRELRIRFAENGKKVALQYGSESYCSAVTQIYTRLLSPVTPAIRGGISSAPEAL